MNTKKLQAYVKIMGKVVTRKASYQHVIFFDGDRIWACNSDTIVGLMTSALEMGSDFILDDPFTFLRTVRKLKCAEVAFERDEDTLRLRTESYTLALARKERDAPDFPVLEERTPGNFEGDMSLSLPAADWLSLLTGVSRALSQYGVGDYKYRPTLAHIQIEYIEDHWQSLVIAAAADGFQLTTRTLCRGIGWGDVGEHFVPARGLSAVLAFLSYCEDDCWVRLTRSGTTVLWSVAAGHVLYQTEQMEEPTFPDASKVIPSCADGEEFGIVVERKPLLTVLDLLSTQNNLVILQPSETSLTLRGAEKYDTPNERTSATVDVFRAESLPPSKIGVDINYLLNALKSAPDDSLILQWPDHDSPLIIRTLDARYVAIIMPVYLTSLADEYREEDEEPSIPEYMLETPPGEVTPELAPSPGNETTDAQ